MIKINNYKTFADDVYGDVYVAIDNLGVHMGDEGYWVNLSFSMYSDIDCNDRLENVPNTLTCPYDLASTMNAVKYGYEQLKLLSSFVDSTKV